MTLTTAAPIGDKKRDKGRKLSSTPTMPSASETIPTKNNMKPSMLSQSRCDI